MSERSTLEKLEGLEDTWRGYHIGDIAGAAIERIAELEEERRISQKSRSHDVTYYRKLIKELEATIEQVRGCQRYTIHHDSYTTDNPTGKWMKAEDVLEAIK